MSQDVTSYEWDDAWVLLTTLACHRSLTTDQTHCPQQRHYQKQNLATVYYQIYRIYGQNKSQHHKESSGGSSASGTVGIVLVLPMKHPSAEQTDDIIIRSVIMMMDPRHSTIELSTGLREGLIYRIKGNCFNDIYFPIARRLSTFKCLFNIIVS